MSDCIPELPMQPPDAAVAQPPAAPDVVAPPDELAALRSRRHHDAQLRRQHEWIFIAVALALVVALLWGEP